MPDSRRSTIAALVLVALCIASDCALATAQRTFVASGGDDANSCSVGAPCRTFGAAIVQTTPGGEVVALDSAGYGAVTIGKPVTIVAPQGVYAGISVFGGTGITVNPGSGDVTLRNLNLVGLGGAIGIDFQSGDQLTIEGVAINGFATFGIKSQRTSTARIVIKDSEVRRNGVHGATIGTLAGTIDADVQRSRFEENQGAGLHFTDRVHGNVTDTTMSANSYGFVLQPVNPLATAADGVVACTRCEVTGSTVAGALVGTTATCLHGPAILISGSQFVGNQIALYAQSCGFMEVADSTFAGNATTKAIDAGGGLFSYKTNRSSATNITSGPAWTGADLTE